MPRPPQAALLPPGFFDMKVTPGEGSAAVEADIAQLSTPRTDVITAEGDVLLSYQGMTIHADRLELQPDDRRAAGRRQRGDLATGPAISFEMDKRRGDRRDEGSLHRFADHHNLGWRDRHGARASHYQDALATILTEASYSPCGLCIDSKGPQDRLEGQGGADDLRPREGFGYPRAALARTARHSGRLGSVVLDARSDAAARPGHALAPIRLFAKRAASKSLSPIFVPVGEDIDLLLSPHADEPAGRSCPRPS